MFFFWELRFSEVTYFRYYNFFDSESIWIFLDFILSQLPFTDSLFRNSIFLFSIVSAYPFEFGLSVKLLPKSIDRKIQRIQRTTIESSIYYVFSEEVFIDCTVELEILEKSMTFGRKNRKLVPISKGMCFLFLRMIIWMMIIEWRLSFLSYYWSQETIFNSSIQNLEKIFRFVIFVFFEEYFVILSFYILLFFQKKKKRKMSKSINFRNW